MSAFTSDVSTSDFWLLQDTGYVPVALVIGNSVYSMGVLGGLATGIKGITKGELTQITELMYNAREMALGRMQAEADKLGADGVIGVKLKIQYMHNDEWMEVTAIGTAIKFAGGKGGRRSASVVIPVQSESVSTNV